MLDKILKILWLLNGVLLLGLLVFVGYHIFSQELSTNRFDTVATEIPYKDELEGTAELTEPQSLVYGNIKDIPGTTIRILPISQHHSNALQSQPGEPEEIRSTGDPEVNPITNNNVNLIFLDIDYKVLKTLLDRKAFIHSTASPLVEAVNNTLNPGIRNLVYLISFTDSNRDGMLNKADDSDLYVSNIGGSNLVQVTKDGLVQNYKFINNNTEILISFRNRGESESEPPHFAKYQIARERLVEMSDLREELSKVNNLMQADSTERKK